jgi:hypothetical protein
MKNKSPTHWPGFTPAELVKAYLKLGGLGRLAQGEISSRAGMTGEH